MKYTQETLNNAIYFLVPNFKKAVDNGIDMNVSQMLSSIADEYFVKSIDHEWCESDSYDQGMAYLICKSAMQDLHDVGWFTFGELEFEFENKGSNK